MCLFSLFSPDCFAGLKKKKVVDDYCLLVPEKLTFFYINICYFLWPLCFQVRNVLSFESIYFP